MLRAIAAVCISLVCANAKHIPGKLSLLNESSSPHAKCLDGSMGGFYYRAPNETKFAKNFVFMLQGGGECVDEKSCVARTKQALGSSKYFAKTMTLSGIQGEEPQHNPDFGGFHMIFIPYCSGDLHTGQSTAKNEWGVQFSGHHIVQAVIEAAIAEYSLQDATQVILSGESAGGIGAFANMDFVHEMLPRVKTFVGVPIGGFYFSNSFPYTGPGAKTYIPWSFGNLKTYYKLWDSFVPTACAAALTASPWECIFAVKSYETLNTSVFVVEAQTDKVVMPLHDGLPLNKPFPDPVLEYMATWASNMTSNLEELTGGGRGDGLFNPACLIHTGFKVAGPKIGGRNYLDAIGDWMYERGAKSVISQDHCPPDSNFGVLCNPGPCA